MTAARRPLAVALAMAALLVAACGGDDQAQTTTKTAQGQCREVAPPPVKGQSFKHPATVLARGEPATASVQTSCGTFVIKLDTVQSPKTANSFAFLAEQGFYDHTVFHRIVPDFVIQGGDPKGSDPALAGGGGPGYAVREPPPQRAEYTRGVVAMAKTGVEPPGTSGSQFFVVTAPADAGLPPDYAVVGTVIHGMDAVAAIAKLGNPATEMPTQTVTIDRVTVESG
jgi:cyclophilin family peptidyl-prolyl cis-trans isomerase